jgi:hypothetical protein
MNSKYTLKVLPFVVMFFISEHSHASIKDDFSKGTQAFRLGNYSQAIKYFKQTQEKGLESASLYFNLGSTYYKLKEFNKSDYYFKRLRSYPSMRYIAEYNLGLINKKTGNTKKAEIWFTGVTKKSKEKKLIALAKEQLNPKQKKIKKKVDDKVWSAYTSISFGSDSNINSSPSGVVSNQSDNFMAVSASSYYLFNENITNGWLAAVDFYHIGYSDFNENNAAQYGIAIKNNRKLSDWKTRFSGKLYKSTFSGNNYQSVFLLEAGGYYEFSKENLLKLRYRYYDINSDDVIYDYLEGSKQKIRTEYAHYNKTSKQRFYYELELNSRQDSDTSSYSPTRHTLRAIHTKKVNNKIQWGGDVSYRASNYPNVASQSRDDTRLKYGAFTAYRFDKTMKLKAKYMHTDNSSSDNNYDYDKNLLTVTLSKIW